MRAAALGLCLCLLVTGCTMAEVNEVVVIKYHPNDDEGWLALKTIGNVVAVPVVAGAYVSWYAFLAWLQSGAPH